MKLKKLHFDGFFFLKFVQFWLHISAPNLKIQVQWIQAPLLTYLESLGPWGRIQSGEK